MSFIKETSIQINMRVENNPVWAVLSHHHCLF